MDVKRCFGPINLEYINKNVNYIVPRIVDFGDESLVELRESTIPDAGLGVFAKVDIPIGALLNLDQKTRHFLNDPLIDLTEIVAASDSDQMLEALKKQLALYYKDENASKLNTRIVSLNMDNIGARVQATKKIQAGTELFRFYGMSIWIREIFYFLTPKTIGGWYAFQKFYLKMYPMDTTNSFFLRSTTHFQKYFTKNIIQDQEWEERIREELRTYKVYT